MSDHMKKSDELLQVMSIWGISYEHAVIIVRTMAQKLDKMDNRAFDNLREGMRLTHPKPDNDHALLNKRR